MEICTCPQCVAARGKRQPGLKKLKSPSQTSVARLYEVVLNTMAIGCWMGGMGLCIAIALDEHSAWWDIACLACVLIGVGMACMLVTAGNHASEMRVSPSKEGDRHERL